MNDASGSLGLLLNGVPVWSDAPAGTPVLDWVRARGLVATREGCHEGDCGACLVLLGEMDDQRRIRYHPVVSCLLPLADAAGSHVVTAEGLGGPDLSPVQQALVDEGAIQCGFCTPGLVVALTGFLLNSPVLDEAAARDTLDGNLCRCTGYASIVRAARRLLDLLADRLPAEPAERVIPLIEAGVLPAFFAEAPARLAELSRPLRIPLDALPVGGATDLMVQRPDALLRAPFASVRSRPGTTGIREERGEVRIGAATTFAELRDSPLLARLMPDMHDLMGRVASSPIRHRATLGGNIVNASPIGDLTILLLALDTRLHLDGPGGERELPLESLFLGYKKLALLPGEWLVETSFPLPPTGSRVHFEKVSKRPRLDIASVNSALWVLVDGTLIQEARLSAGGVAPIPRLLDKTSTYLAGRAVSAETVRGAIASALEEVAPIDDVRGSAAYKRLLLERLIIAHFLALFPHYLTLGDLG